MSKERNSNIELLRNISMFFIVLIHLFEKTSAIFDIPIDSSAYYFSWIIYAVCRMGNNLFIIISGYFYREVRFKLDKFLKLLVQVFFYSVILALVAKFCLGIELKSGWRNVLFPISKGEYWFMTVYMALYCFMPYINKFVETLSSKTYRRLLLLCFVTFSLVPTFVNKDFLNFGGAYGLVWFVYLYLIGAYIRENKGKISDFFLGREKLFWLIIIIIPVYKFVLEFLRSFSIEHYIADAWEEALYKSNSPIILLASVFSLSVL